MAVAISRCVLDAILAHCRSDATVERCGLLLGQGDAITGFLPAANVHPDPRRHFELDPAVLLASHRRARMGGPAMVGHCHSHPDGKAEPSLADADAVDGEGRLWMIVAGADVSLWRARSGGARHGRFERVAIELVDPAPPGADKLASESTAS